MLAIRIGIYLFSLRFISEFHNKHASERESTMSQEEEEEEEEEKAEIIPERAASLPSIENASFDSVCLEIRFFFLGPILVH